MTFEMAAGREQVVGFIDMGTNSIRLLLVRILPDRSFLVLNDVKETVRLGEGEFRDNLLQPAAMKRAGLVCARFAEMARNQGAAEIVAVATSATRDAKNRRQFLRYLQRRAQLDVRVISGQEEARLIYLGVASAFKLGTNQAVFIDIGGGSTEVIIGDQQQHHLLDSLKLGAIRLSTQFFRPDETGPVSAEKYERLQRYVRSRSVRTLQRVKEFRRDMAIGSSGTIMNLAEVAMRLAEKRSLKKDEAVTTGQLRNAVRLLCSLPLDERRKVPGINPERADIILGGAAILETLLDELGMSEIHITDRGLRDGLPLDYLSRCDHPEVARPTAQPGAATPPATSAAVSSKTGEEAPGGEAPAGLEAAASTVAAEQPSVAVTTPTPEPGPMTSSAALPAAMPPVFPTVFPTVFPAAFSGQMSFRERSVLELGRRCGFDEPHARQVARLAGQLFDSARSLGLHPLGDWERELLEYAALLHDIGSFVSYSNHRAHSYYLIRNAELLGFDQTELGIIANTALFHHKAFPRSKEHTEFAELDKRARDIVKTLCVLLRIAESLDRSHLGAIAEARLRASQRKRDKGIVLDLTPARECQLELWEVRTHAGAFAKAFGRELFIKCLKLPR